MSALYKVTEENENVLDSTIAKTYEKTTEFTLRAVIQHQEELTRKKKEYQSKIAIEEATIENILMNNPDLKYLTDEKIHAAYMLWKSRHYVKEASGAVDILTKSLDEYQTEKEDILKQLNITL